MKRAAAAALSGRTRVAQSRSPPKIPRICRRLVKRL
jgi:hypothetical protein